MFREIGDNFLRGAVFIAYPLEKLSGGRRMPVARDEEDLLLSLGQRFNSNTREAYSVLEYESRSPKVYGENV